jgi:DNA-directed RNA polymerase specialized sigma24 family protein
METERRPLEEISLEVFTRCVDTVRWIVQHDQDAQDLVQEAHIRAFRRGREL